MPKTAANELQERNGIKINSDATYGIITDETQSIPKRLMQNTGLLTNAPIVAKPIKTVNIIPTTALKKHTIPEETHDNRKHAVKIGEGYYNAQNLAVICGIIGNRNVEFYQTSKDGELGIKTEQGKAVMAPIILEVKTDTKYHRMLAEIEIAKIPTLDKVMDDFFSGKKPPREPKFSLREYTASKKY